MPTIAIQFARFGPYHLARIESAVLALGNSDWKVVGLETAGTDATYAWKEEAGQQSWKRHTVFPDEEWESIPPNRKRKGMKEALDALRLDAVCISGWGSPDARACLDWCKRNGAHAVVMSETREADGQRRWWKEWFKRRLIKACDAALVGGKSQGDYLVKLGLASDRIQTGYNVVNNRFFSEAAQQYRQADAQLSIRPYFLASNRFIERKNLHRLIEAYAKALVESSTTSKWDLCLLGDGPLMGSLMESCEVLDLHVNENAPWEGKPSGKPRVFFPGFRQIEELPRFYTHAGCFIHPALEEPWGLVINEAMACGLPVFSSNNVGAAEELVREGVNGWTFNPDSTAEISTNLEAVCNLEHHELASMGQSSSTILEERCPSSAFGDSLAALLVNNK